MRPTSAYIHVPFCKHRCGYCNFTLVANRDDLIPKYLDALKLEISQVLKAPQPIKTLFLGGGTPSHLSAGELHQLLELICDWLRMEPGGEFSCEMNPADCTPEKLKLLANFGVNRISLGGQSFSDRKLAALERDHSGIELRTAIETAYREISNVSLDLIFAAPEEKLSDWKQDLISATSLPINHLSAYGLTVEKGSAFYGRVASGKLKEIDETLQLAMYEMSIEHMTQIDAWEHYEVSNFAKHQCRCEHNQVYWLAKPWYGFGPGAASMLGSDQESHPFVRRVNHRSTNTYIKRISEQRSVIEEESYLNEEQAIREQVVFGLRMLEGVCLDLIAERWCRETVRPMFEPYLTNFIEQGWLQQIDNTISLTRKGLYVSDGLWPDLLGD